MERDLTRAGQFGNGTADIRWDVDYGAHPLLDPEFADYPSRQRDLARATYERIRDDDDAYRRETARLLRPLREVEGGAAGCQADITLVGQYLSEADIYICSTIDLLPTAASDHLRPRAEVAECHDLRDLLGLVFHTEDLRLRYEAQRKLYLAQLLIDIDHSRHIQDGPQHLVYLEGLLQDSLWRYTRQTHELSIGYLIGEDGETISYTSRPQAQHRLWTFRSIYLEKPAADRKLCLDILYYDCRFKRAIAPLSFEEVDGQRHVVERLRWRQMRQASSGSILSKMIRKGINNPDEIADLIAARFIVHDEDALNDLLLLLEAAIGNPFRWRNVTDTLGDERQGRQLNVYSSKRFRVFKGDMDILIPRTAAAPQPYHFNVEVQIYTLESYLRTVCSSHEASHQALKQRQFLFGLVPMIFPRSIYGSDWLDRIL